MANNIAARLHQALLDAGLPVVSVSIPDLNNRETWSAQYTRVLTPVEKTTEQTIGAAIPLTDPQDAIYSAAVALATTVNGVDATALTLAQLRSLILLLTAREGWIAYNGVKYTINVH